MKSIITIIAIVIASSSINTFATTVPMTLAQKAAAIQTARNAANLAMIQQNNAIQTYNNNRQNLSTAGLQQIQNIFTNSQNVYKQTADTISSIQGATLAPTLQPVKIPAPVAAPQPVKPAPINYAPVAAPTNVAAPAIINPQPINQAPTVKVIPPVMNPSPVKPAPIINAPAYQAPVKQPVAAQAPSQQIPTAKTLVAVVANPAPVATSAPAPIAQAPKAPQPMQQQAPATKTLVAVVPNTTVKTQVSNVVPPITVANPTVASAPQIVTVSSIVKGKDGRDGVSVKGDKGDSIKGDRGLTGKAGRDGKDGITTVKHEVDTATINTVKTLKAQTSAQAKDLSAAKSSFQALNNNTNQRFKSLSDKVDNNRKQANAGISGAMAMAGLPQVQANQKVMFSAGGATYEGESALAIGASVNFNDHVIGKVNFSTDTANNMGASVGVGVGF